MAATESASAATPPWRLHRLQDSLKLDVDAGGCTIGRAHVVGEPKYISRRHATFRPAAKGVLDVTFAGQLSFVWSAQRPREWQRLGKGARAVLQNGDCVALEPPRLRRGIFRTQLAGAPLPACHMPRFEDQNDARRSDEEQGAPSKRARSSAAPPAAPPAAAAPVADAAAAPAAAPAASQRGPSLEEQLDSILDEPLEASLRAFREGEEVIDLSLSDDDEEKQGEGREPEKEKAHAIAPSPASRPAAPAAPSSSAAGPKAAGPKATGKAPGKAAGGAESLASPWSSKQLASPWTIASGACKAAPVRPSPPRQCRGHSSTTCPAHVLDTSRIGRLPLPRRRAERAGWVGRAGRRAARQIRRATLLVARREAAGVAGAQEALERALRQRRRPLEHAPLRRPHLWPRRAREGGRLGGGHFALRPRARRGHGPLVRAAAAPRRRRVAPRPRRQAGHRPRPVRGGVRARDRVRGPRLPVRRRRHLREAGARQPGAVAAARAERPPRRGQARARLAPRRRRAEPPPLTGGVLANRLGTFSDPSL